MSNEFNTSRLILRPLQLTDAPSIFEIRAQDAVHVNFLTSQWTDPCEATLWIHEIFESHGRIYTISLLSNPSSIIGAIGINRWGTLFYMLHPTHWNQGYCTEALKGFLPELWKHDPDRLYISAAIIEGNVASKRVLEKCGFEEKDPWMSDDRPTHRRSSAALEEEGGQSSEDEVGIEVDEIMVDMNGKRRLSKIEIEELGKAIEGLKVQTKPAIEPIRADIGGAPRKNTRLIAFRYERKFETDALLSVLDGGEYF